ncbi:MAG: hypothetical protein QG650_919, partial [Patescibacteria group bacterium]|nr:hypothetical protein [Patescibacteria group bacterium]
STNLGTKAADWMYGPASAPVTPPEKKKG